MKELKYFKDTGMPVITAAIAGICKIEWVDVSHHDEFNKAIEVMKEQRFDILPIRENDGNYYQCYMTIHWGKWNRDNIQIHSIKDEDRIYYLTNIQDTIAMLVKRQHNFFFLDNLTEIVGLLTISALNCQSVYTHVYNQIAQLEKAISEYIKSKGVSEEDVISLFKSKKDTVSVTDLLNRFEKDKAEGTDPPFLEYLNLIHLFDVLMKTGLLKELLISESNKSLKKKIDKINRIRNIVAHPTRSLVQSEKSVIDLHSALCAIDELLDKIPIEQ